MQKKSLNSLTNQDLADHPLWEYLRTDQVEIGINVRAVDISSKARLEERLRTAVVFDLFYAQVKFTSKNGREFFGFCKITNHTYKFLIQPYSPVIIVGDTHIPLWYGMLLPDKKELEEYYMLMRINPEDLFPLKMNVVPEVFHIENEGIIPGFCGVDAKIKDVVIIKP